MKKTLLYFLVGLYLTFVAIDFFTAIKITPTLPNIILKLIFSLGCLFWIHLDRNVVGDPTDFDFVRLFLIFMFIADTILGTLAKLEGLLGDVFFTTGIVSAIFGQLALILRHLRLSVFERSHAIGPISLDVSRRAQLYYFLVFGLMEASILFMGIRLGQLVSSPFFVTYVVISLASLAAAFIYLLSGNQVRSKVFACLGVALLIISDAFTGFGSAFVSEQAYLELIVWGLYAPVLLLLGGSILRPIPASLSQATNPAAL